MEQTPKPSPERQAEFKPTIAGVAKRVGEFASHVSGLRLPRFLRTPEQGSFEQEVASEQKPHYKSKFRRAFGALFNRNVSSPTSAEQGQANSSDSPFITSVRRLMGVKTSSEAATPDPNTLQRSNTSDAKTQSSDLAVPERTSVYRGSDSVASATGAVEQTPSALPDSSRPESQPVTAEETGTEAIADMPLIVEAPPAATRMRTEIAARIDPTAAAEVAAPIGLEIPTASVAADAISPGVAAESANIDSQNAISSTAQQRERERVQVEPAYYSTNSDSSVAPEVRYVQPAGYTRLERQLAAGSVLLGAGLLHERRKRKKADKQLANTVSRTNQTIQSQQSKIQQLERQATTASPNILSRSPNQAMATAGNVLANTPTQPNRSPTSPNTKPPKPPIRYTQPPAPTPSERRSAEERKPFVSPPPERPNIDTYSAAKEQVFPAAAPELAKQKSVLFDVPSAPSSVENSMASAHKTQEAENASWAARQQADVEKRVNAEQRATLMVNSELNVQNHNSMKLESNIATQVRVEQGIDSPSRGSDSQELAPIPEELLRELRHETRGSEDADFKAAQAASQMRASSQSGASVGASDTSNGPTVTSKSASKGRSADDTAKKQRQAFWATVVLIALMLVAYLTLRRP